MWLATRFTTGWTLTRPTVISIGIAVLVLNAIILFALPNIRHYAPLDSSGFIRIPAWFTGDLSQSTKHGIPKGEPLYLHYLRFRPSARKNLTLRFTDYLSVLSAVQRLKPDQIFLHGDIEPVGHYWNLLKSQNWISHRPRNKSDILSGRVRQIHNIFHMSDMAKLDILLEYGGLAADFDVYFVRGHRLREILSRHSSLTCYGDEDGYNSGLVGFAKDSKLLAAWRRSYDVIYTKDWNFNSGDVQKYLSEVFADEVYVINYVCNHPHAYALHRFFNESGVIDWRYSAATHTYTRFSFVPEIKGPEDLAGRITSYKELLLTIYENRTLPPEDPEFQDRVDPLGELPQYAE